MTDSIKLHYSLRNKEEIFNIPYSKSISNRVLLINYLSKNKLQLEKLSQSDLINIGYMAGRFGVSLDGDLNKNYKPEVNEKGVYKQIFNSNCLHYLILLKSYSLEFVLK